MGDVKLALLLVLGLDGSALRALALGLALAALAGCALVAPARQDGFESLAASCAVYRRRCSRGGGRVIGRTRIARRLEATLAVTALLLVLALGWELRPALPQLPQSFSAPLPSGTIGATLELAAWIVFVLLDLVLIRKVLQFAIRREPTRTELRLRHAFAQHELLQSTEHATGEHTRRRSHHRSSASPHVANPLNESRQHRTSAARPARALCARRSRTD